MTDEQKGDGDAKERELLEDYSEWKDGAAADEDDPRETFRKASHIALCISYDVIDKLRWWEKETLKLSDEEIEARLPHMRAFLDGLTTAYVGFSDVDL